MAYRHVGGATIQQCTISKLLFHYEVYRLFIHLFGCADSALNQKGFKRCKWVKISAERCCIAMILSTFTYARPQLSGMYFTNLAIEAVHGDFHFVASVIAFFGNSTTYAQYSDYSHKQGDTQRTYEGFSFMVQRQLSWNYWCYGVDSYWNLQIQSTHLLRW